MKFFEQIVIVLSILSFVCSCSGNQIKFEEPISDDNLIDKVQSIELIPLESGDDCVLGTSVDLFVSRNYDFILVDRDNSIIQRYSSDGRFLNEIGKKGKGPGEFISINNVQLQDTCISVFTITGKVIKYTLSGDIVATDANQRYGQSAYYVDEGILAYYNYAPDRAYRMALLSGSGDEMARYLKTYSQVLPLYHTAPVFSDIASGGVSIIDSYSNCIYRYCDCRVSPYLSFDFGKYNISKKFYKFRNVREGVDFLQNCDFALIDRYIESESIKLASFYIVKDRAMITMNGLFHNGKWSWVYIALDNPFYNSFRAVTGDIIVCLLDPVKFDGLNEKWRNYITNREVLEQINEDNNYVIAKVRIH